MGEFEKDPKQGGFEKEEKGGKPAFDQLDKGQQGQQDFGQKETDPTDKEKLAEGQQQADSKHQRQQGDQDLGEDSLDSNDLKTK